MVNAIVGGHPGGPPGRAPGAPGEYGISDVYVGVPVRLGRAGVEEIVELDLYDAELDALRDAAEGIRAKCADLAKLT